MFLYLEMPRGKFPPFSFYFHLLSVTADDALRTLAAVMTTLALHTFRETVFRAQGEAGACKKQAVSNEQMKVSHIPNVFWTFLKPEGTRRKERGSGFGGMKEKVFADCRTRLCIASDRDTFSLNNQVNRFEFVLVPRAKSHLSESKRRYHRETSVESFDLILLLNYPT